MQNQSLEKKILDEINKTGFPLELRMADFLQSNDYYVANSLYYIDQDEDKGREIDLRALKNHFLDFYLEDDPSEFDLPCAVRDCLLIECKRSDKPWVIFTSFETSYDKEIFNLDCEGFGKDAVWYTDNFLDDLEKIHPFATNRMRGRGHFEPFKGGEGGEMIFKALTTVVKATIATRNNRFGARTTGSICFYYPIVVFDGLLYEAHLKNGTMDLNETDMVFVSFFYTSGKYEEETFIVPVVTEKGFSIFCAALDKVRELFGKLLADNPNMFEKPSDE